MNATVKAKVHSDLKSQSEVVLRQMGMDMTGAIKMFLTQVVMRQALPFEVKVVQPNAITLGAIEASYKGDVQAFDSVESMMADANR